MPGLTGLEAIRLAKEASPSTRYYIMTGFDEFEYAKQAVKLKVEDYLMKPLDQKTIWETIQTARALEYSTLREKKTVFRNWLENVINHRKGFPRQIRRLLWLSHPDRHRSRRAPCTNFFPNSCSLMKTILYQSFSRQSDPPALLFRGSRASPPHVQGAFRAVSCRWSFLLRLYGYPQQR